MSQDDRDSQPITQDRAAGKEENGPAAADPAAEDDRLLDLLERWEERYRNDEDAAPESLGVDDPALMEALRERIERLKRLHDFMKMSQSDQGCRETAGVDAAKPPPLSITPPPQPSLTIGRYRVLRVLGEGGFGRVYLAYDVDLQREVAVKVPFPGDASRYLDVEAYLREARIVARLNHPNIVPVYDVGRTEDGRCFVVSKYMEGGDLKSWLGRSRPEFAKSTGLVAVLCDALQYTHTQDLFHRDIKPANILLDAAGSPSLADFGLALRDEDVGRGAGYLGTAAYMSPEQARGEGHRVDGRSDIFSIGVVLYELLTGRRPFRGSSHAEIMHQLVSGEPRPPRQIDGSIPSELERICLKALAKRASERYTTARDLAEDLRHFLATASWAGPTSEITPVVASAREPTPTPTSPASDSNLRPIRIVPKGLGSFDETDADFFLELLPGPRDRDGLPEGLRFWKTRIETNDPERAFRVGLIYGPSGCGKSSMVKAGLLPRLGPQVCTIYVEASGADTEARLLRSLHRLFPSLPSDGGLAEIVKVLRRGRGLPAGRKVLLVLDQFEQWLFARRDGQGDELIAALRQCDGEHVQALSLVRDDFWMAATRFMRELDIELVPERNVAAVDLFEPRHARKVLAAYGRAYDALPPQSADRSRDQDAFLDQAVTGLAQDGRIVPVRLALFAEMVKGRPWTPATLREVGGMDGVGVKFLEDTFNSPRSNPNHRYHQRAAQAVLKALLPETNADIKGRMRSVEELRDVSGYANRPSDFADLVRMLDSELRLITPVDPEGSVDDDVPSPVPGGRCFQLTHDYLVHALRDWLTRKQRETRRGRAELLLAERSSLWNNKPEDRYLPSFREWANIRLLTERRGWSEPQRRMMKRAGRRIGLRGLAVAAAVGVASAVGLEIRRQVLEGYVATYAGGIVSRLVSADTAGVPDILPGVREYRRWAEPPLRRIAAARSDESKEKLHAALGLLQFDDGQLGYVYRRLLSANPAETAVIRDVFGPYRNRLTGRLWAELGAAGPGDRHVLPVACTLARYEPDSPAWNQLGGKVAEGMLRAKIDDVKEWRVALRSVRAALTDRLAEIFRGRAPGHVEHELAAELLADYGADRPRFLLDVMLDAEPKSYSLFFAAINARGDELLDDLRDEVRPRSDDPPGDRPAEVPATIRKAEGPRSKPSTRAASAARRARAAVALVRLGHADSLWDLLNHRPDPEVRCAFITSLHPYGADPAILAKELRRLADSGEPARPVGAGIGEKNAHLFDPAISKRRGLIQALAEYPRDALAADDEAAVSEVLSRLYLEDPDSGVHSAAELALRRWGHADRLMPVKAPPPPAGHPIERRWYVNAERQTMIVIDGPVEFAMGEPPARNQRQQVAVYHRRLIPRRFAVGAREVSVEQFQRFAIEVRGAPHKFQKELSPESDGPQIAVSWYDAVAYCNWMSQHEGLRPCYVPIDASRPGEGLRIDAEAVRAGGFRLPTQAEWEYACRAGTTTVRYCGVSIDFVPYYEWYGPNAGQNAGYHARACATRLPNEFGFFDLMGNAIEWCHDRKAVVPVPDSLVRDEITGEPIGRDPRVLRGAGFASSSTDLRSAVGGWYNADEIDNQIGFRLARTLP
jgi:serine/threonine protein kinase/formylglycine-generating enzyme required for sulfatase activity